MEACQHTPLWRATHSNASQRNPSAFWLETDHSFPLQLSLDCGLTDAKHRGCLEKDVERMSSFHDMCCPDHQKPRVKPQRICADTCHHPKPLPGSPASYVQHTWLLHNSIHSQEFGHPHAKGQWSELVHGVLPTAALPTETSFQARSQEDRTAAVDQKGKCCQPGNRLNLGKWEETGSQSLWLGRAVVVLIL